MRAAGASLIASACAAVALACAGPASAQSDGWFVQQAFPDSAWTLDDLGIVDYEGDGDLDVFTTNHLSRQYLLANDGTGTFEDRLTAARLDQTPAFPGWDEDPNVPVIDEPGLYIYRNTGIVLRSVGLEQHVSGELRFLSGVNVQQNAGAQLALTRDDSPNLPRSVLRFTLAGDDLVRLKPGAAALPFDVSVDGAVPLHRVYVGRRGVNPGTRAFQLYLRDRHGIAWADYNSDGHLDAFVTRGGVSGKVRRYSGVVQDELLLGDGTAFRNAIAGSGLTKGPCRGRKTAAVDHNRDGRLDVFMECSRGDPRLFRQRKSGSFRNVSGKLRKGKVKGTKFLWLDVDGRGGPELLAARRHRFAVYRWQRRRWSRAQWVRGRHDGAVRKLTVADYDNDGDPDVFAASKTGSTLLVNRRGRLRRVNPRSAGLPPRALTANWVDYDNDGRTDMHLVPGGLYRQRSGHEFTLTPLARPWASPFRATAGWFDFDSDGARDAVLALRDEEGARTTSLGLFRNAGPVGRWLEVELTGPPRNREAIGAKVEARVGGRKLTQWVGQSEGSHLSQGHYRLYFGLGAAPGAVLKVTWPDGSVQKLGGIAADRIVRVTQPG